MELLQPEQAKSSNEQILKLVLDEEELSWQHVIYDLVRNAQMDPWDINVTTLTHEFLNLIKKLQRMDFRISGKLVLAAAVLLKIKSDRLLGEDLTVLDTLINSQEELEDDWLDMDFAEFEQVGEPKEQMPRIYPRTPQPRQRKVSVYDLVTALEHALDTNLRRNQRSLDRVEVNEVHVPQKQIDVSAAMNTLLERITAHHQEHGKAAFSSFIIDAHRTTTVLTFIPLLHLKNERRIDLEQPEHFKEIHIHLLDSNPVVSAVE